jgi:hypothetical protein
MNSNPYLEGHIEGETVFQGGDRELATQLVTSEYEGQDPMPCDCGGTLFYKATVGAYKCPDCGVLTDSSGEPY